jgi:hypothetical protein
MIGASAEKSNNRPCARLETTANLGIARLASFTDDRALNALDLA